MTAKFVHRHSPWKLRPGEKRTILVLGDIIAALTAWGIAAYVWWISDHPWNTLPGRAFFADIPFWFYLLSFFWLLLLIELYDIRKASRWDDTLKGVLTAAAAGLGLYLLVYFTSPPRSLPRKGVAAFVIAATLLTLLWRYIFIRVFISARFMRRVLIVGAGKAGTTIVNVIDSLWPPPFFVVGLIDDDPKKIGAKINDHPVLGSSKDLLDIVQKEAVSDIIVAISGQMLPRMFQAILDAQESGVEISTMAAVYEELLGRLPIHHLDADWLIRSFVDEVRVSTFYRWGKRALDIIGGAIGVALLIAMAPFLSLAIALESRGPVFFSQPRAGRGGQPFRIYKFRTMRPAPPEHEQGKWADDDEHRITRIGRILRKTHLDEFPQFINVLRGEMSLVGPRPEQPALIAKLEKEIPFYRARLLVKPGLTGWAQINHGYVASVHETEIKLEYDLYYIRHRNLWLDIFIILRTFGTIFGGRGR